MCSSRRSVPWGLVFLPSVMGGNWDLDVRKEDIIILSILTSF